MAREPKPKQKRVLPASFYSRATLKVAKDLLGKVLLARDGRVWRFGYIVEDEAYLSNDPACHSYNGPTKRNQSMFKGPGTAYVYRIHQVHCVNAVTRPGEAVLIRAIQPIKNIRGSTNGPGRLCTALGITREKYDGLSFVSSKELQILSDGNFSGFRVGVSSRIGISKSVDEPYRFYVKDNLFLSR
jgi:DNA-3-methyladenine glycosylase